jgi:hypothetical protein
MTFFPGKDFPDREKWIAIRATPPTLHRERPLQPPPLHLNILRAVIHWILENARNTNEEPK